MSDEKNAPHSLAAFLRGPAPAADPPREDADVAASPPPRAADPDDAAATRPQPAHEHADAASTAACAGPAVSAIEETPAPVAESPHAAPSFMRTARTGEVQRPASRWQWPLLAGLALLLALQVLLADRARLAADASWRPLLTTLCAVLHCELPAWHEPAAFSMLDREVRPAPDQRGVLQVQASFRNDARWAQAWPRLQLSLSDADGRVIGSRVFLPQEYLGHALAPGDTLAPGQGAQIAFRVREPAAGTAAFGFEFR